MLLLLVEKIRARDFKNGWGRPSGLVDSWVRKWGRACFIKLQSIASWMWWKTLKDHLNWHTEWNTVDQLREKLLIFSELGLPAMKDIVKNKTSIRTIDILCDP